MTDTRTIAAIVVAAGRGERASANGETLPKQYRLLAGLPMLQRTLAAMLSVGAIHRVLPVIGSEHGDLYAALGLIDSRLLPPVVGASHRQASVLAGLDALGPLQPDLVLIHDAARPFADASVIAAVVAALDGADAALPALPVTDTIKRSPDGRMITGTEDRHTLYAAQTPQGFRYPQIHAAHRRAAQQPQSFTDDAAIAEWAGLGVALVPGSTRNIKVTLPEDFSRAERMIMESTEMETRIGTGFDVHPFAPGNAVWLGGVEIPHSSRLQGHSDADAVLHALTDAVYGALGEGDIGSHFPPSDPQWKDAASSVFLEHAAGLVAQRGGRIVNLDATIVCEAPRIGPHAATMKETIAAICGVSAVRVAIKATTSEQLGFVGRGEGVVAMATASIELPRSAE